MAMAERFDYVVVGGGVAGTCCARLLCTKAPKATVCLVSPTEILKTIKVVQRVTDNIELWHFVAALLEARRARLPSNAPPASAQLD